ncbi:gamma-glutamylcyclotransferase family protein [Jannaschia marina]|uniref:gamma-glutamylcyclotransferase family protein n=1 Tax=Jannaschia marina TaxID=2741674 RepID=UPI0015CA957F|nr:gamma-glutamylcyclotransferase family protein [Jannaschia marina]
MNRFFGYGSLVNRQTHVYPGAKRMRVAGWRRVWRATPINHVSFLTGEPCEGSVIEGLSADVPMGDWAALDLRETGYLRAKLPEGPQIYHIPHDLHGPADGPRPILQSYLDVVVQGFLREFGEEGVARFFDTTAGWETPIRNDRGAPEYPRAQTLSAEEMALVDRYVERMRQRRA